MLSAVAVVLTKTLTYSGCTSVFSKTVNHHYSKKQVQERAMSSPSSTSLLKEFAGNVIPPLDHSKHKGQAGIVAVIGGCQEYTGAPYFAAISALKVGADLAHVFCTQSAAPVIKGYSPELIVHPVLDQVYAVSCIQTWLPRFHSLVVGPGLGREPSVMKSAKGAIKKAKERNMPIIIDADGLFLVTNDPKLISGYTNAILTPNVAEFNRLFQAMFDRAPNARDPVEDVQLLCQKLGHVTIVHKGFHDIVSNGHSVLTNSLPGSMRRCGGQGDLLSGSLGTFAAWAKLAEEAENRRADAPPPYHSSGMKASYLACALTRECARRAFYNHRRSTTTSDLIKQIQFSFEDLFPVPADSPWK